MTLLVESIERGGSKGWGRYDLVFDDNGASELETIEIEGARAGTK